MEYDLSSTGVSRTSPSVNHCVTISPNLWENEIIQPRDLSKKDLIAIIPAFNEELVIGSMVLQTRQFVDKVIVVDDGSKDKTSRITNNPIFTDQR
ncbi:MAG: glycosyltransferase [Methanomicrobiaceae archaeon]|nr:glycosyltransferase [Methanomicrobiaceae archaeon]